MWAASAASTCPHGGGAKQPNAELVGQAAPPALLSVGALATAGCALGLTAAEAGLHGTVCMRWHPWNGRHCRTSSTCSRQSSDRNPPIACRTAWLPCVQPRAARAGQAGPGVAAHSRMGRRLGGGSDRSGSRDCERPAPAEQSRQWTLRRQQRTAYTCHHAALSVISWTLSLACVQACRCCPAAAFAGSGLLHGCRGPTLGLVGPGCPEGPANQRE